LQTLENEESARAVWVGLGFPAAVIESDKSANATTSVVDGNLRLQDSSIGEIPE
jgi:hypothetical protein